MPDGFPPANPFQTMVDTELAAAGNLLDAYNRHAAGQAAQIPAGTFDDKPQDVPNSIPLKLLCERHPEYMAECWADCDALYKGGHHLLRSDKVMARLFPSHNAERMDIYQERRRRAFYINYAGTIIDQLAAGLESDPLRLGVSGAKPDDDTVVPEWWSEWAKEVTADGADLEHRHSLHSFVVEVVKAALVKQSAWVLIDLPKADPDVVATVDSLAMQDELGMRDPYLCLLEADAVVDWEADDDGRLLWVNVWSVERRRPSLGEARGILRHTWTLWGVDGWQRYQLDVNPAKIPHPDTPVPKVAEGTHPFESVPLIRFKLPDGLWAMGKLESLAREHLNKRNASAWAEYKSLFAILYEFMGPESAVAKVVSASQKDPERATNQIRGQGWTQRRGAEDRAEYIGPDTAPFAEARTSCAELMQEMYRVTSMMAASANMDSKALQRSGDSKADDRKDTQVVLEALGFRGRGLVDSIIDMVAIGRGEEHNLDALGMEAFNIASSAERITEAVELFAGVPILSPTFKRRFLERLYQVLLGDDAEQEDLDAIKEELNTAIEAEGVMLGMGPGGIGSMAGGEVPTDPSEEDGEDVDPDDEDAAPPKRGPPRKAPSGRTIFGTGKLAPAKPKG